VAAWIRAQSSRHLPAQEGLKPVVCADACLPKEHVRDDTSHHGCVLIREPAQVRNVVFTL
jgi:hypothetical protein